MSEKLPSLYQLSADYSAAVEILSDMDADEQTVKDTLEGLSGLLEVKAANVFMFMRDLEGRAKAFRAEEARLAICGEFMEKRAGQIKDYLKNAMKGAGIKKIEAPKDYPVFRYLAVRDNPPAVEIDNEDDVPAIFFPPPPPPKEPELKPDKKRLKAAIEAATENGGYIPGAHITQGTRLEIK